MTSGFFRQIASTFFLCSLVLTGCAPSLDTTYAEPRGTSINGISAFIDVLRQSGRKVDIWPAMSPLMHDKYGTVIVFMSNFDAPSEKLTSNVDLMLHFGGLRQLVVVVRDSDASIDYWRQIEQQPTDNKDQSPIIHKSYIAAKEILQEKTSSEFSAETGTWYGMTHIDRDRNESMRSVECQTDEGETVIEAGWPLNRKLVPAEDATVIWHAGDDPLLTEQNWEKSSLFVMSSATPLLNGGMVDPGNRKLVVELMKLLPANESIGVSLSSNWLENTEYESPGLLKFIKVHPNGWIFGQGIFAIVLFCWWKYPIFGRPRTTTNVETVRFGRHVEALGMLLRRSRHTEFAWDRIRAWYGKAKPTPGAEPKMARVKSEVPPKSTPNTEDSSGSAIEQA